MKIWSDLLNLFYPNLCLLCKEPLIQGEEHICSYCLYKLPQTGFHLLDNNPAEQLFIGKFPVEHASSFLYYTKGGNTQKLIHSLKYNNNKELGYYLGKLAAQTLMQTNYCNDIDLLVPVPLHPNRLKSRGYNQSEWIANGIASLLCKSIDSTSLQRIKKTTTQTSKSVFNRWSNVQDIYNVQSTLNFTGKHILLVDDVITSGATTGAAAEAILKVPNTRISILSIAIA